MWPVSFPQSGLRNEPLSSPSRTDWSHDCEFKWVFKRDWPQLHPCVSLIYHSRELLTWVELSDTNLPEDPERVSGDQLYQWIRSHFLSAFHLGDMYAVQSDWDLNYYFHHSRKCYSFKETHTHLLVCFEIPFYIISLFLFFTVLISLIRKEETDY